MTTPKLRETQSGSLAPQSAHVGLACKIFLMAGFRTWFPCEPSSLRLPRASIPSMLLRVRNRGSVMSTRSPFARPPASARPSALMSDACRRNPSANACAVVRARSAGPPDAAAELPFFGPSPASRSSASDGWPPWVSCRSMHDLIPSTHMRYSAGPDAWSMYEGLLGLKSSKQNRTGDPPPPTPFPGFSETSRTVHRTTSQTLMRSSAPPDVPPLPLWRLPFSPRTPPLR
mmetsp:Transcript_1587/g.3400  ORF Transcript_1587/g.3400 Transcript_1587/m.3400 type:complete len:230 (-) Transcript_1587:649-1338(-)